MQHGLSAPRTVTDRILQQATDENVRNLQCAQAFIHPPVLAAIIRIFPRALLAQLRYGRQLEKGAV